MDILLNPQKNIKDKLIKVSELIQNRDNDSAIQNALLAEEWYFLWCYNPNNQQEINEILTNETNQTVLTYASIALEKKIKAGLEICPLLVDTIIQALQKDIGEIPIKFLLTCLSNYTLSKKVDLIAITSALASKHQLLFFINLFDDCFEYPFLYSREFLTEITPMIVAHLNTMHFNDELLNDLYSLIDHIISCGNFAEFEDSCQCSILGFLCTFSQTPKYYFLSLDLYTQLLRFDLSQDKLASIIEATLTNELRPFSEIFSLFMQSCSSEEEIDRIVSSVMCLWSKIFEQSFFFLNPQCSNLVFTILNEQITVLLTFPSQFFDAFSHFEAITAAPIDFLLELIYKSASFPQVAPYILQNIINTFIHHFQDQLLSFIVSKPADDFLFMFCAQYLRPLWSTLVPHFKEALNAAQQIGPGHLIFISKITRTSQEAIEYSARFVNPNLTTHYTAVDCYSSFISNCKGEFLTVIKSQIPDFRGILNNQLQSLIQPQTEFCDLFIKSLIICITHFDVVDNCLSRWSDWIKPIIVSFIQPNTISFLIDLIESLPKYSSLSPIKCEVFHAIFSSQNPFFMFPELEYQEEISRVLSSFAGNGWIQNPDMIIGFLFQRFSSPNFMETNCTYYHFFLLERLFHLLPKESLPERFTPLTTFINQIPVDSNMHLLIYVFSFLNSFSSVFCSAQTDYICQMSNQVFQFLYNALSSSFEQVMCQSLKTMVSFFNFLTPEFQNVAFTKILELLRTTVTITSAMDFIFSIRQILEYKELDQLQPQDLIERLKGITSETIAPVFLPLFCSDEDISDNDQRALEKILYQRDVSNRIQQACNVLHITQF